jgi:hypothetical protein
VVVLQEEQNLAVSGEIALLKSPVAFFGKSRNGECNQKREDLDCPCDSFFHVPFFPLLIVEAAGKNTADAEFADAFEIPLF